MTLSAEEIDVSERALAIAKGLAPSKTRSIRKSETPKEIPPPRMALLLDDEELESVETPSPLIDTILPANSLAQIFGASGVQVLRGR